MKKNRREARDDLKINAMKRGTGGEDNKLEEEGEREARVD